MSESETRRTALAQLEFRRQNSATAMLYYSGEKKSAWVKAKYWQSETTNLSIEEPIHR